MVPTVVHVLRRLWTRLESLAEDYFTYFTLFKYFTLLLELIYNISMSQERSPEYITRSVSATDTFSGELCKA